MEATNQQQTRERWRLDKHIPAAVIIAILLQFGGFIWYAAKMDSIVSTVPQIDERLRMVESTRFTDRDAESLSQKISDTIRLELAPLRAQVEFHAHQINELKRNQP